MLDSGQITTEMLLARLRAAEEENRSLKGEEIEEDPTPQPQYSKKQLTWMGVTISEAQRNAMNANRPPLDPQVYASMRRTVGREHGEETGNMLALVARIQNIREENSKLKK
jgi:hypothetical protein